MSTRPLLIIRKRQMDAMAAAMGRDAVMPCKRTWVAITLMDENAKPIQGVTYRFELPSGSVANDSLDGEGTVRFDSIDPGQCKIGFPELRNFGLGG